MLLLMVTSLRLPMPVKVCSNLNYYYTVLPCCCYAGESVSVLQLIQEIKAKVGKEEDGEDYEALERVVQSNNFNSLMEVSL